MTARKSGCRKTARKPARQTFGERVDAAVAETTTRAFAWLGRSLIGLVAKILWPIRLWPAARRRPAVRTTCLESPAR